MNETIQMGCPNCGKIINVVNSDFEENFRCIHCYKLLNRAELLSKKDED